jgi:IS4 transposase
LVYAEYVIVFTTFPEDEFSANEILEWYRIRWQVELVFKRFKQIAQLGHLPKHDDESAKAWLYGKLFAALVTEKIVAYATSFSPWGYNVGQPPPAESLA